MKLVLVSDTHCYEPVLPPGDLLLHAGDFLSSGSSTEAFKAGTWLGREAKKFKNVVCIAGNHDRVFEKRGFRGNIEFLAQFADNIHYLENSEIEIDGLKIYGSPVSPEFNNWSFNVPRGAAIKEYWDKIPADVDVLMTHGPPIGILDQAAPHFNTPHLGCEELRTAVNRIAPKLHVFGHIHGGAGTVTTTSTIFVNASLCNEAYKPINDPTTITL